MNNELHLIILLTVKYEPVKTPCFFKAVIPYSEQVGEYLQLLPINGDIRSLYILNPTVFVGIRAGKLVFQIKEVNG